MRTIASLRNAFSSKRAAMIFLTGSVLIGAVSIPAVQAEPVYSDSCASIMAPTYNQVGGAFDGGGIPFVMDAGSDILFPDRSPDPSSARPVEVVATGSLRSPCFRRRVLNALAIAILCLRCC